MSAWVLPLMLSLFMVSPQGAQNLEEIKVNSWQKGTETVHDQTVSITLGPHQRDYVMYVVGKSGKKYKLRVIPNPYSNVKMEHWQVELREVMPSITQGEERLGYNLLTAEMPGPEKHNFPMQDYVGYFYPHEDPPVQIVGGVRFIESHLFYPINAKRMIRVEGFTLTLKVNDFRRNSQDGTKVDYLNLSVKFRSAPADR